MIPKQNHDDRGQIVFDALSIEELQLSPFFAMLIESQREHRANNPVLTSANVGSKALSGIGSVLNVVTVPLDVVSFYFFARDLKGRAKSETGKEFSRLANQFEVERYNIERCLEYINEQTTIGDNLWRRPKYTRIIDEKE